MTIKTYYYSQFGKEYIGYSVVIKDKEIMPNTDDNSHVRFIEHTTPYKTDYTIKWLDKYDFEFVPGLYAVISFGRGDHYLYNNWFDKIRLQFIWGRGFAGWFNIDGNFKTYIFPFITLLVGGVMGFLIHTISQK